MQISNNVQVTVKGRIRQEHRLATVDQNLGVLVFRGSTQEAPFEGADEVWALSREGDLISSLSARRYLLLRQDLPLVEGRSEGISAEVSLVYRGQAAQLKPEQPLSASYSLWIAGQPVFTVRRQKLLSRNALIEVHRAVDLPLVVFAYYICAVRWRLARRRRRIASR